MKSDPTLTTPEERAAERVAEDEAVSDEMIAAGAQVHRDNDFQSDEEIAVKIYRAMRRAKREEFDRLARSGWVQALADAANDAFPRVKNAMRKG